MCSVNFILIMSITRCVFKASFIGDFLFKNHIISELNTKIFGSSNLDAATKNIFLYSHKTYSKSCSIVKENSFSKKRLTKKKKFLPNEKDGLKIVAFSTAEEYNLEMLSSALQQYTEFIPSTFGSEFSSTVDVVHATQKSKTGLAGQDVFFFRKGCVVMWNFPTSQMKSILDFLKHYEDSSFSDDLIKNESEVISYSASDEVAQTQICQNNLILSNKGDILLEKYAVSNAMALSVHLGTYEANLEQYIETMEPVTDDLKKGSQIKMSRNEVLQKTGQLFALRHNINLNSDLLDTPDFYWDREELENLYQITFNYFCISKRTRVINEKINHCIELVELLSSHLNDKHHVRLEWMIIILIMVEVAFEICHYLERVQ